MTVAGSRFGQFDQQRVQQFDHMLVDVLRAVVGMEGENHKRELVEEIFQHWDQVPFADFLHRSDNFELCHLIDGVHMVNPLHPIEIALVDRIHAQIPRLTIGLGLTTFTKAGNRGAGLREVLTNTLVRGAMP